MHADVSNSMKATNKIVASLQSQLAKVQAKQGKGAPAWQQPAWTPKPKSEQAPAPKGGKDAKKQPGGGKGAGKKAANRRRKHTDA